FSRDWSSDVCSSDLAQLLQHDVRFRKVLAVRAFTLNEIRYGVQAKPVHAHLQPEAHDVRYGLEYFGIVEVEVRLMAEEPVPVELFGNRIPCPVGRLRVRKDDPGARVLVRIVAPHVEITLR